MKESRLSEKKVKLQNDYIAGSNENARDALKIWKFITNFCLRSRYAEKLERHFLLVKVQDQSRSIMLITGSSS